MSGLFKFKSYVLYKNVVTHILLGKLYIQKSSRINPMTRLSNNGQELKSVNRRLNLVLLLFIAILGKDLLINRRAYMQHAKNILHKTANCISIEKD